VIRAERRGLILGVTIALGWTLVKVTIPWLVRVGIDRGIDGDGSLLLATLAIIGAGVISGSLTGLRRYWGFRNARRVERRLRDELFTHLLGLDFGFHDENKTGDLMSRASTDIQQIQNFVMMLPVTFGNFITIIAASVLLLVTEPTLALLALIGLPLVNVLGMRYSQRVHPAMVGVQNESAELATVVEETVAGIRVVKGFGSEDLFARRLAVEAADVRHWAYTASTIRSKFLPAIELLPNLGLVLVLARGGHLVLDGRMTIGELISFNIYLLLLIQPLRMIGMVVSFGQRATAAGARVSSVLETKPAIAGPADPTILAEPGVLADETGVGRVQFRGVFFRYGSGAPVLTNLDLEVEAGETIAIVGATGSGKSTIARLLPRFYDPFEGQILLDGVDIRELALPALRRAVGIVFEETFLFSASVRDNIAFAHPDAPREDIRRVAVLAGADEFISELSDGYDTLLGERGYSLSGGQRQRLAIARALLGEPRVVILDDATSAVDPTKEHEIRDALSALTGQRTTIVIAHRPATIALADRVAFLDGGRVAAEGRHDELLATNQRYRQVLAAAATEPEEG